jgi:hypothetical protein
MAKGIYNGVGNVARKVATPYVGVDNVSRKVIDGYIGIDNVARKCFPSDVSWGKYACDYYPEYYEREEINEPYPMGNHSFSVGSPMNLITSYSFHGSIGYLVRTTTVTIPTPPTLENLNNAFSGKFYYDGWSNPNVQEIYRYDTVTSFYLYGDDNGYFACTGTLVERCTRFPAQYFKRDEFYGVIIAESGELPEEGTLVEGSFDEGYCVLQVGSTYYYYILED